MQEIKLGGGMGACGVLACWHAPDGCCCSSLLLALPPLVLVLLLLVAFPDCTLMKREGRGCGACIPAHRCAGCPSVLLHPIAGQALLALAPAFCLTVPVRGSAGMHHRTCSMAGLCTPVLNCPCSSAVAIIIIGGSPPLSWLPFLALSSFAVSTIKIRGLAPLQHDRALLVPVLSPCALGAPSPLLN